MGSVEILLTTHNGGRYLAPLLDSLFEQSCQDFSILAADDASSDSTLSILTNYQHRYPDRIRLFAFREGPVGVCANFSRLMEMANADYVMLCDQDDVWLPNKVALSLERVRANEAANGVATPLLVHTDSVVTSKDHTPLSASFLRYANLCPARDSLACLLVQNVVSGFTILMNRALYERARPIPQEAVMHDWWCALVTAVIGKIVYVDTATALYRQHGDNTVGAKAWNLSFVLRRARIAIASREFEANMSKKIVQAEALLARYERSMSPRFHDVTTTMTQLWGLRPFERFWRLRRVGLTLNGTLRNIALFITVTFHRTGAARRGNEFSPVRPHRTGLRPQAEVEDRGADCGRGN